MLEKNMKRITDSRLTPLLNITGEGIRRAREEAGYTQKQLSIKLETKAVYICRGSLSRVEHGSRIVTDLELQAISEVLNVPMERLFPEKSKDESPPDRKAACAPSCLPFPPGNGCAIPPRPL